MFKIEGNVSRLRARSSHFVGHLPPATVAKLTGHYGLLGLRERAHLVGGQLDILSAPGAGTTLRLHLPEANGGQAV